MTLVREAMVPDPPALDGSASAQEAGELLSRDEVRAVFVSENGRLIGVITRKTLVREIVAAGLDPSATHVAAIAEEPYLPIDASTELTAAFHLLEEHDLERVPVTEDGRLVGMLSRAVLQRRLAEDAPPPGEDQAPA
jgi:CBS domain-containing protein